MMGGYGPGAPMGGPMQPGGKMNVLSLLSLISGAVSLPACFCSCFLPLLSAVPAVAAIVMGIIGMNQVRQSQGQEKGGPMAIIGIVCGALGLVLALLAFLTTLDDMITNRFH
jgi:predicted acyltransferase